LFVVIARKGWKKGDRKNPVGVRGIAGPRLVFYWGRQNHEEKK